MLWFSNLAPTQPPPPALASAPQQQQQQQQEAAQPQGLWSFSYFWCVSFSVLIRKILILLGISPNQGVIMKEQNKYIK